MIFIKFKTYHKMPVCIESNYLSLNLFTYTCNKIFFPWVIFFRGDASTGSRRKGMRYLDGTTILVSMAPSWHIQDTPDFFLQTFRVLIKKNTRRYIINNQRLWISCESWMIQYLLNIVNGSSFFLLWHRETNLIHMIKFHKKSCFLLSSNFVHF